MTLFPAHTQYVFAGKSAIALVLYYLRLGGVLRDKSDQVLVPEWLGTWVYMTMHNYCFPTTTMNDKVRAMLVYHQWGFPQKMEAIQKFARKHRLFVIEDCAHAIEGAYRGKRLGEFGDAAVWSLSKFFDTPAGGALYAKDKRLRAFAASAIRASDRALGREALRILRTGDAARAYALYDRLARMPEGALASVRKDALEKRRKNFALLRAALWSKKEERLLDGSEVTPWMVPLFAGAANKKVAAALHKAGFESGVYHFDINRNMLAPRFVECVGLPCHSRLSKKDIERIARVVREARR